MVLAYYAFGIAGYTAKCQMVGEFFFHSLFQYEMFYADKQIIYILAKYSPIYWSHWFSKH